MVSVRIRARGSLREGGGGGWDRGARAGCGIAFFILEDRTNYSGWCVEGAI